VDQFPWKPNVDNNTQFTLSLPEFQSEVMLAQSIKHVEKIEWKSNLTQP